MQAHYEQTVRERAARPCRSREWSGSGSLPRRRRRRRCSSINPSSSDGGGGSGSGGGVVSNVERRAACVVAAVVVGGPFRRSSSPHRRLRLAGAGQYLLRPQDRAWQILLATSYDAIQINKRMSNALMGVAVKGPGRYCSPRHRMPFKSRNEGSDCVSMKWPAISARPYWRIALISCFVRANLAASVASVLSDG